MRLYYPDPRYVSVRLANFFDSVHEPENPSPETLPQELRPFWDEVFRQSEQVYGENGRAHSIPEKTAWRALRMHFEEDGTGAWLRKEAPSRSAFLLEDPGDVVWLGKLLDYTWIEPDGTVVQRVFDDPPPDLLWSQSRKTLYSFPTATIPEHCQPLTDDLLDEAKMFKRWAQRDAKCARDVGVTPVEMYPLGSADSVSYRSDKWHDENPDFKRLSGSDEYIHVHGDGVWVWEDAAGVEGDVPNVVVIRGGRLDVEERGIIH